MAITTRYFSTTSAGAADGTTWADRAALFSAGNWSTVISGFDFSTNSLVCRIGPGSYTCSQALTTTVITTDPSNALPLFLHGCDSSGNLLAPPDPDWTSDMPAWDDSTLPVIATTTNVATVTVASCNISLIKFTGSGRNGGIITGAQAMLWCVIANSTANTNASAAATVVNPYGCVFTCTGSSYDFVLSVGGNADNCRIEGVAGSSGNRRGLISAGTATNLTRLTIVNCGGEGALVTSASAAQSLRIYRSVIANNASTGIKGTSTASQTTTYETHGCMITGNGTAGIDGVSDAVRWVISCNRLRDNTTNIQGVGNYPTDFNNYTTDSDDSTEYVSAGANGDFRIKNTASAIWGKGYGVSDQPPAIPFGGGALL